MNDEKYEFRISKKELLKSFWSPFVAFRLFFLIDQFKVSKILIIGTFIVFLSICIFNLIFCKSFNFFNRTVEITYFFLPFFKQKINLNVITDLKIHYHIKGRDLPFLKFTFNNNRSLTIHFIYLIDEDIIKMIQLFKANGIMVDLN